MRPTVPTPATPCDRGPPRRPRGTPVSYTHLVFMHHAQDRQINTPLNEESGKRGGTHNSLTRIFIKPTHLAGGYAQFAYAFNYYGPTGNNRDEVTAVSYTHLDVYKRQTSSPSASPARPSACRAASVTSVCPSSSWSAPSSWALASSA